MHCFVSECTGVLFQECMYEMKYFSPVQREWNKQYRDNTSKVVGWPSHMYESFIIVVSAHLGPVASMLCV